MLETIIEVQGYQKWKIAKLLNHRNEESFSGKQTNKQTNNVVSSSSIKFGGRESYSITIAKVQFPFAALKMPEHE